MQNYRCFTCSFYLGDLSCMAFEEIPASILLGDSNHSKVINGQNGDFVYIKASETVVDDFLRIQ
jgi:hypothetical protein